MAVLATLECGSDDFKFTFGQFQWLPSDIFVDQDGKVTFTSPNINNVHPIQHKELVDSTTCRSDV